jgi:hypothetical protein
VLRSGKESSCTSTAETSSRAQTRSRATTTVRHLVSLRRHQARRRTRARQALLRGGVDRYGGTVDVHRRRRGADRARRRDRGGARSRRTASTKRAGPCCARSTSRLARDLSPNGWKERSLVANDPVAELDPRFSSKRRGPDAVGRRARQSREGRGLLVVDCAARRSPPSHDAVVGVVGRLAVLLHGARRA